MPKLHIGDIIPNFCALTTRGKINFYEWQENMWIVLFSHPKDFTPVCTSELASIADHQPYFARRNTKFLAHSCDSLEEHLAWEKDIKYYCRNMPTEKFPYPIMADKSGEIAKFFDMFDANSFNGNLSATIRALYLIDPSHRLRYSLYYPATTGRNLEELLRVIDSIQLTDRVPQIQTPINWKPGEKVLIKPDVSEGTLRQAFPKGTKTEYVMTKGAIKTTEDYDMGYSSSNFFCSNKLFY